MGSNVDDDRIEEQLLGPANVTGAINTASYTTQFTIQPDVTFGGPDDFDQLNVWYTANGGSIGTGKPLETTAVLSTDGAQTGSSVALETPSLVYRPGTHVDISGGFFVPTLPTGDAVVEALYGREPRTIVDPYDGTDVDVGKEYAGFRIRHDADTDRDVDLEFVVGTDADGDGTADENVVRITGGDWRSGEFVTDFDTDPKAKVYGKDPLDGTGVSGIDFDARDGYVYGVEIGWYGPTSMVPYVIDVGNVAGTWKQRKWPILIYNPVDTPAIKRPNQPFRVAVDNGSSGQDLDVRVGGRKGAYRGAVRHEPPSDSHTVTGQTVATTGGTDGTGGLNWRVVAAVKTRASDPDTIIAPEAPMISTTNDAVVMVRIVDESDLSGTIEYDEPSNTHRDDVTFAIDSASDTPTRLSVDTVTVDGESKFAGVKVGGRLLSSSGPNSPGLNEAGDFGFTVPRDKVLVHMIAARGNNDVDVDATYQYVTIG